MKGEENSISEYYDMFSSDYSIDDFFVVKFKSVGKGRQMTSAVVHSNRIEGVKEDKSVELEVKKFLITFNITQNPQAISMTISIAVKSLNTMHHDSMSVNFVRFVHTFPIPHNAT